MKKLEFYISKQILIGFLLICFTLMSIIWLSQSLRFLDLIASKGISISVFIQITSLLMPRIFAILAPIAFFASVLFVYNRMLSDQELVVMRSAGISPLKLSLPVFYCAFILALVNIYTTNYAIPHAENAFNDLEWKIKNNVSHLLFREGEFTTLQPKLTVFVASHEDDGTVGGILINDERSPSKKSITSAEKGIIVTTSKGPRIILINGNRQELSSNNMFSSVSFERYSVDFGLKKTKSRRQNSVRTQSFSELITSLNNSDIPQNQRFKSFVEGNKRITSPFLALVFGLLGCTGLLISNFNRRGQAKTIIISLFITVMIQAVDLTSANLSSKHLTWLILLYANTFIPIIISVLLLSFPYRRFFAINKKNPYIEEMSHA